MIITFLTVLLAVLMTNAARLDAKFVITKTELKERYYTKIVVIIGLLLFEFIYLEQTFEVFAYGLLAFYLIFSANKDRNMILWFKNNDDENKK